MVTVFYMLPVFQQLACMTANVGVQGPMQVWFTCCRVLLTLQAMGDDARAEKLPRLEQDTSGSPNAAADAAAAAAGTSVTAGADESMQVDGAGTSAADAAAAAAAAAGASGDVQGGPEGGGRGEGLADGSGSSEDDDLAAEVIRTVKKGKDDPLAAYDIDVQEDGEAIHMYLSMLESAAGSSR